MINYFQLKKRINELENENKSLKENLDKSLMDYSKLKEELETTKNHYVDILGDAVETIEKARLIIDDYKDYLNCGEYQMKHAKRYN